MPKNLIGFIGLGWIGKNYADNFVARGYKTIRYSKEDIYSQNKDHIQECDIVFIAVPTPTTYQGFNDNIVREVIKLVGKGKIAVIKSTLLPGTTESIQKENPHIFVMHSPEFLSRSTAAHDAAYPDRNIIGVPVANELYYQKAREVLKILPKAPFNIICSSKNAELIKYGGNCFFYFKNIFFNLFYDYANKINCNWDIVRQSIVADPRIKDVHTNPIDRGGRGAGGECLIKDFEAFISMYGKEVNDENGLKILYSVRDKNIQLLSETNKDIDILKGVYNQETFFDSRKKKKEKIKCLVTGGAGFIGSNLVDELIRLGNEVVIIDDLSTGKAEYINPQAKFYRVDICEQEKVNKIFEQESKDGEINYVFHLAAQIDVRISVRDPNKDNQINVVGGINILEACQKFNVGKIVFSSTGGAVYGDTKNIPTPETEILRPISPYGIHKLTFEKYLNYYYQVYGQDYTILRFANVYGPRQYKGGEAGVVTIFVDNAVNQRPSIINGSGQQTRDYVYVGDVVRACVLAMLTPYQGEINIGTSVETDILKIVRLIEKASGQKMQVSHGPAKDGEQLRSCLDIQKANMVLGWEPQIGIEEGISQTIKWSRGNTNWEIPKPANSNKNKTILVTGSAGFIGFHVAKRLLDSGYQVIGVDNFNDYYNPQLKEDRNKILEIYPKYKLYRADLVDLGVVKKIFQENKIDQVCHLAAQAGVRHSLTNPHAYIQSNLVAFENLIDEAKNFLVEKFIYASSSSVYGQNKKIPFSVNDTVNDPISLYAVTKRANELIAKSYNHLYGLKCVGLRFFTVYGPWGRPDMACYKFADLMRQGKPIEVYNFGKMKRDFTYIDDIVSGVISVIEKDFNFKIFNLGNDQPEELENFISILENYLGVKAKKNYLPIQPGDIVVNWADIEESRKLLNYSPKTKIEEGIKKFADWYKAYYGLQV